MTNDYVHITLLLDRSGSMASIRDDAIGGFNQFVADQQAQPGRATLTLVQFDSQASHDVVHHFRAIETVPPLTAKTFTPRGGTPLFDAVGRTVKELERDLAALTPEACPSEVVLVVLTDGQENSSRQFNRKKIKALLAAKQEMGWRVLFLSADLSAVDEAVDSGFRGSRSAYFDKSAQGISQAMYFVSDKVQMLRHAKATRASFAPDDAAAAAREAAEIEAALDFSDEERQQAAKPDQAPKKP